MSRISTGSWMTAITAAQLVAELPVREIQENLVRLVLSEQQRPLLAARRAEVETLAAERTECRLHNAAGVVRAEVDKVALKVRVQLIAAAGNVAMT